MSECIPRRLYVYNAKLIGTSEFFAGTETPQTDPDKEIWPAIQTFSERIGIAGPHDLLDLVRHVGFVSFHDARQARRLSHGWSEVAGVRLHPVSIHGSSPKVDATPKPYLPNLPKLF